MLVPSNHQVLPRQLTMTTGATLPGQGLPTIRSFKPTSLHPSTQYWNHIIYTVYIYKHIYIHIVWHTFWVSDGLNLDHFRCEPRIDMFWWQPPLNRSWQVFERRCWWKMEMLMNILPNTRAFSSASNSPTSRPAIYWLSFHGPSQ